MRPPAQTTVPGQQAQNVGNFKEMADTSGRVGAEVECNIEVLRDVYVTNIKYNRLNELYFIINNQREMKIESGTQRDREK